MKDPSRKERDWRDQAAYRVDRGAEPRVWKQDGVRDRMDTPPLAPYVPPWEECAGLRGPTAGATLWEKNSDVLGVVTRPPLSQSQKDATIEGNKILPMEIGVL